MAIDTSKLASSFGVKVIPVNAREGKGLAELKRAIQTSIPAPKENFIDIHSLCPEIIEEVKVITGTQSDYAAFQIACHYINIFCFNVEQKGRIKNVLEKYQFTASKFQGEEIVKRYEKINPILTEKMAWKTK